MNDVSKFSYCIQEIQDYYYIRAFLKLVYKYPEWKLQIVGDGPDKERLLELINQLNLGDKVEITEFCRNIIEKYREAEFSILTSQKEGFGCILIESNAIGIPVISFDNVGSKEIIENNINGFLVEKNNDNDISVVYFVGEKKLGCQERRSY